MTATALDAVLQNWKGGTIAIRNSAFFRIGGFDEGFVDWGGEDDEFFDRCQSLNHCVYGFLPFVHQWHEVQPQRLDRDNLNETVILPERLSMSCRKRVGELCLRDFGKIAGPDPAVSYQNQQLLMKTELNPGHESL
jgi:hypothetical protein